MCCVQWIGGKRETVPRDRLVVTFYGRLVTNSTLLANDKLVTFAATITEVRIEAIIMYSGWRTLSFGIISMTLFCTNVSGLFEKEGSHIQQVFQREQRCLAMKLVVMKLILDKSLAKFVKIHVNA